MQNLYRRSVLYIVIVCTFWGCMPFDPGRQPPEPSYEVPGLPGDPWPYWLCRPDTDDPCDQVPLNSGLTDNQATAEADCFAVHATSYLIGTTWIADATEEGEPWSSSMFAKAQLSAFNGTCRIYAPRYRQFMAMAVPFANDATFAEILDFAYQDVYDAFIHYLQNDNDGRPFFLVGHSQGSWHLERLVREEIEGTALADGLVAAYLIGAVLRTDSFTQIPSCDHPQETGCVVGWNTVAQGFTTGISTAIEAFLERVPGVPHCTNPLSWTDGGGHA